MRKGGAGPGGCALSGLQVHQVLQAMPYDSRTLSLFATRPHQVCTVAQPYRALWARSAVASASLATRSTWHHAPRPPARRAASRSRRTRTAWPYRTWGLMRSCSRTGARWPSRGPWHQCGCSWPGREEEAGKVCTRVNPYHLAQSSVGMASRGLLLQTFINVTDSIIPPGIIA